MVLAGMVSLGVFMQGCSNEDEITENEIIDKQSSNLKLKSLVTSFEYVDYNKSLKEFGKSLKVNYSKLPTADKSQVVDILNKINILSQEGDNFYSQKQFDQLLEELSLVIKVDFKKNIESLNNKAVGLSSYNEVNNISKKEFVIAINKHANSDMPRLKKREGKGKGKGRGRG